jgi:adenylosuccinate synthase
MDKQLFIVTDLGGGDGGKGGVVHKLCSRHDIHTVVKVGGAQGSHGVSTSRGENFSFSHFGCGTFDGCRTHISKKMVVDPNALVYEGELLKYQQGIRNIFDLMTIDEDALCVTPFHRITSRLRELSRKGNPKGTIGVGVGEAVFDAECFPDLAITVKDIAKPHLRDKLEALRVQKIADLTEIIARVDEFWRNDQETARDLIEVLQNPNAVDATFDCWRQMNAFVKTVPTDYLGNEILSRDGSVVVETSHGILTDRYYGFHPHTTKLRTVPDVTLTMLEEAGYRGEIIKLGVTRAYQIRHGAGPMVTEAPELLDSLLPGSNKEENRWQGKVRVGPLDMVALRYAINVCGGSQAFDALAVTWFDQINVFGHWPVCNKYTGAHDQTYFTSDGEIKIHRGIGESQLRHQEELGLHLRGCKPIVTNYPLSSSGEQKELVDLCAEVFKEKLSLPVRMISFGPTENDKVCL